MDTLQNLLAKQRPIKEAFDGWLTENALDPELLHRLHGEATVAAHAHYYATISIYRKLCDDLGLADCTDAEVIRAELSSTDDMFKSYSAEWVDDADYTAMTQWLRQIYAGEIEVDASAIDSIEQWIAELENAGVRVRYSSGTSGQLAFVPRDDLTYGALTGHSAQLVFSMISERKIDPTKYDAFLLSFRGGGQGFSTFAEHLGMLAHSHAYLFDFPVEADMVRAIVRGIASEEQQARFETFRAETIDKLPESNRRILDGIARSQDEGRPVLIYGPPFQVLDLCKILEGDDRSLALHEDSLLVLGGGWKSFEGARIPREELVELAGERFGIDSRQVLEGYGMTECNIQALRCLEGRFHIPPLIAPTVVDEALYPLPDLGRGRFAFSDPFAVSYPGFIITGDEVELADDLCPCGKSGYSIVGEITRAAGEEIKGCGGVMASVRA